MIGEGREETIKSENKEINSNDPRSPFYLSSSNNPNNIISSIILDAENYAHYSCVLTNALKSKNKFILVSCDIERPDDTPQVLMPGKNAIQW